MAILTLAGQVYVAPPDCHLLVDGARVRVTRGPRENGNHPAADPLFRTIDSAGVVATADRAARALFGLGIDTSGTPLKDLGVSYRPLDLRSLVDDVLSSRRSVSVADVEWTTPVGEQEYLDVSMLPVSADGSAGVSATYSQVGRSKLVER